MSANVVHKFRLSLGNVFFYGEGEPKLNKDALASDRKRCVVKSILLIAAACFVFYTMLRMSTQLTYCPSSQEYTKGDLARNALVVVCQIFASILFVPTFMYSVHQGFKAVDITRKLPAFMQVKAE